MTDVERDAAMVWKYSLGAGDLPRRVQVNPPEGSQLLHVGVFPELPEHGTSPTTWEVAAWVLWYPGRTPTDERTDEPLTVPHEFYITGTGHLVPAEFVGRYVTTLLAEPPQATHPVAMHIFHKAWRIAE